MRLEAFRGAWRITRRIEDIRNGQSGRFQGTARFLPAPDGLEYREEGRLTFADGASFAATRCYLWGEDALGGIEVRFADGRFFHRFRPEEARPAASHDCPPDRYDVTYDFRRWPEWRVEWRALGPAKDYVLVSDYRPTGQEGESPA